MKQLNNNLNIKACPKNVPLITSMLSTHMHKEYAKKPKATDKLIAEILDVAWAALMSILKLQRTTNVILCHLLSQVICLITKILYLASETHSLVKEVE